MTTRHSRHLTKNDQLKIVALRYGSLTEFGLPIRSYLDITRSIFIPYGTVRRVCLKFEAVNRSLENLTKKNSRAFRMIPASIK